MEPVSAFATIVGLLANFKNERKATSDDEYRDFVDWLNEHRHKEMVDLLVLNTKATISIKALLNQDREQLLEKLESIDRFLAAISGQIDGIGDLARSLKPGIELSDQAISILRQIEKAKASAFVVITYSREIILTLSDGGGGNIEYSEPRFLEDDLETLVSLELLLQDLNRSEQPVYKATRKASKLIELVDSK